MFPVAFGVIEYGTTDSWEWFVHNMRRAIGCPQGLVISTDARKDIGVVVSKVYNGAEHIECFRHLYKNFRKFKGDDFEKNMWPATLSYTVHNYNKHCFVVAKHHKAVQYLEENHMHMWAISKFSKVSKVGYVNNNMSE